MQLKTRDNTFKDFFSPTTVVKFAKNDLKKRINLQFQQMIIVCFHAVQQFQHWHKNAYSEILRVHNVLIT